MSIIASAYQNLLPNRIVVDKLKDYSTFLQTVSADCSSDMRLKCSAYNDNGETLSRSPCYIREQSRNNIRGYAVIFYRRHSMLCKEIACHILVNVLYPPSIDGFLEVV